MQDDLSMEGLIDYLAELIANEFADEVSQIYFGDVGIYPPKAFRNENGEEAMVLAFIPDFDRDGPGRTGASSFRNLGVFIVGMVNMVPYFEAMPTEAPAERKLVRFITKLRKFLDQEVNFNLGGRVLSTKVGDVNWDWQQRQNISIRSAAISYTALTDNSRHLI